jgi:cobalt-zinc-cadmium efflux system protein
MATKNYKIKNMPHHHHHVHSETHSHNLEGGSKAFAIGIALNVIFILVEVYFGVVAKSLALISDAGHNLGDVAGLILSWIGLSLASRAPKGRFTYGLQSASILSAIINSVILLVAVGAILVEAFDRINSPNIIDSNLVIIVALIGILINGVTAALFYFSGSKELNIRAAFIHMAGDALVSLGVVGSGLLIKYTGLNWIDAATSILIAFVILYSSWGLLKDSIELSLHATPKYIDIKKVEEFLLTQKNITKVLDLHVWAISTSEAALSAHLLAPDGVDDNFLKNLEIEIEKHFQIGHSTIQIMRESTKVYRY